VETIVADSGRSVYPDVLKHIVANGVKRIARGRDTIDAGYTSLLLRSPLDAYPEQLGRKLNRAIGTAEALQLIGGFSAPSLMLRISERFGQYMNGDGFHGAYGSRIRHQMLNVATKLRGDEGTRQAIVTLWDPVLDNIPDMRDYPCTIMLQFQIEEGRLCMNVVMRSNDAWLGLPYDLFQFSQLQLTLARSVGLAYGWYRHTALSMHLYLDDLPLVDTVQPDPSKQPFCPLGVGFIEQDNFTNLMKRARRLATGMTVEGMTQSEVWYSDALAPHLG
jgi:thymidylate synthase